MEQTIDGVVLFADVSGSARLYEAAGDQAAYAAVGECMQVFRQRTEAAGGRVVKTMGDGIMALYTDADAAADAAIEMQLGVEALEPVAGTKLGVHIGFHYGPAMEHEGDVFGDAVNLAARLSELASKAQIITSRATADQLNPVLKAACRPLYSISVKGKSEEIEICEVIWRRSDKSATIQSTRPAVSGHQAVLRLRYRSQQIVLGSERRSLTLGRDRTAELLIEDPMASRLHGRIEWRRDKFVLVDHSANGTFVTVQGDRELVLRREEVMLRGHGWIALGQSRESTSEAVEFSCE